MTEHERQDARILLAEKVMRWSITAALPPLGQYSVDDLAVAWRRGQFEKWDPFANPAHAVELMEAARKCGIHANMCSIRGAYEIGLYRLSDSRARLIHSGTEFAETLTTAIHRLVVERPELFAEGK